MFTLPCARRTQRLEIEGTEISGPLAFVNLGIAQECKGESHECADFSSVTGSSPVGGIWSP